MLLTIEVSLLSGRTVSVEAGLEETVETLKHRAQQTLAIGRGRLLDSSGRVLNGTATLEESGLKNGDTLTWHTKSTHIYSNAAAFAAVLGDGSVVTWGDARYGGDSRASRRQLEDVRQIQATNCAFAAILGDGSVARMPTSTLIPFLVGLGSLINPLKQKRAPFFILGYWAT